MLKDFIEISATVVDWRGTRGDLGRVTFRGKDLRTAMRKAIRADADLNLPYHRTFAVFGSGARRIRSALKREMRRRARHTRTVNPMNGIQVLDWMLY